MLKFLTKKSNEIRNTTMASQEAALKEITEKFAGKWKETNSENIEEFFKEMGVNIVLRKVIALIHPESDFVVEGNEIKISFKTPIKTETFVYKYGEETEIENPKGKFKANVTYEGGKLSIKQTPVEGNTEANPIETTREINEKGEMLATIQIGENITCKRVFVKVTN